MLTHRDRLKEQRIRALERIAEIKAEQEGQRVLDEIEIKSWDDEIIKITAKLADYQKRGDLNEKI